MKTDLFFQTPSWISNSIAYQIFPDRFFRPETAGSCSDLDRWGGIPNRENFFGGTLNGITEKLDYLQELGVNLLYLTPIFQAGTNHRYDTVNYYEIDSMLGNKDDFSKLVEALHQRNMRIILDGVFNHSSCQYPAFLDICSRGSDSKYADWYFVNNYPVKKKPVNYQTCGGCEYLPKLNTDNPDVRKEILSVARYWIREFQIDGWRLDCASKVSKDFWKEFYSEVKKENPDAYVVAEIWRETGTWLNCGLFDGAMNYRLRDILLEFIVSNHLDAEDFAYELLSLKEEHGEAVHGMLNLVGSHDVERIMTCCAGDWNKVYLLYALLLTLPGIPMIYYGDEIGLPGGNDPDCRRCMIWNQNDWNTALFSRIKYLMDLRKKHSALRNGTFSVVYTFNGLLVFERKNAEEQILIILNSRNEEKNLKVPVDRTMWMELLTQQIQVSQNGFMYLDKISANSIQILSAQP